MKKWYWICCCVLVLAGCGGGGGSESNSVEGDKSSNATFSLSSSTLVSFTGSEYGGGGFLTAQSISGSVSNGVSNLYIIVDLSQQNLVSEVTLSTSTNSGSINFMPISPALIGRGNHKATIPVRLCEDQACNKELQGSPINVDVEYSITPNTLMAIDLSTTSGGIVTQKNGPFNCYDTCNEEGIFGYEGDDIVLSALPEPGYEFEGWEGDCSGLALCTLAFNEGSSPQVVAKFKPTLAKFNCESVEVITDITQGLVSVPGAERILPLCNGYFLTNDYMMTGLYLKHVFDQNDETFYQLPEVIGEMAYDEENNLVYVTHEYEDFFSRIDLATGHVSSIYNRSDQGRNGGDGQFITSLAVSDKGIIFVNSYISVESGTAIYLSLYDKTGRFLKKFEWDNRKSLFEFSDEAQALSFFYLHDTSGVTYEWGYDLFDSVNLTFTHGDGIIRSDETQCHIGAASANLSQVILPCGYDAYIANSLPLISVASNEELVTFGATYPNSVSFSPLGDIVNLSNGDLRLYYTDTGDELITVSGTPMCESTLSNRKYNGFSTDGSIAFALNICGEKSEVLWTRY